MEKFEEVLKNRYANTVNSYKKDINTVNSIDTVNSKVETILEELQGKPKDVAQIIALKLNDGNSVLYYSILAKNIPLHKLFEALSFTVDAASRGKIRSKKAVYFQAILRNWGYLTKFSH